MPKISKDASEKSDIHDPGFEFQKIAIPKHAHAAEDGHLANGRSAPEKVDGKNQRLEMQRSGIFSKFFTTEIP